MSERLSLRNCIVVVAGAPLHGKTTLGRHLLERTNLVGIDVDEMRRRLFPATSGKMLTPADELWTMVECYHALAREAGVLVTAEPVLLVAPFSRAVFKDPLRLLRQTCGDVEEAPTRIFELAVSSFEMIRERIAAREREGNVSNIRTEEQYRWALTLRDPWWPGSGAISVNGDAAPDAVCATVLGHLQPLAVS